MNFESYFGVEEIESEVLTDRMMRISPVLITLFWKNTPIARSNKMVLKSDGYSSDHIRLNRFVFWSSAVSIGIFGLLFVLFPEKVSFG